MKEDLKNPYREGSYELGDNLADQIMSRLESPIRRSVILPKIQVFKVDNIKNIKDHVFYNEHDLDRHGSDQAKIERKRFDPTFQQALAWKLLETGTYT